MQPTHAILIKLTTRKMILFFGDPTTKIFTVQTSQDHPSLPN